jgi:hypothetical protein
MDALLEGSIMNGQRQTLLAIAGAIVLGTSLVAAQAKPTAPVSPRPATPRPSDEGQAPKPAGKLVAPFRGEAEMHYTKPVTKAAGNMIVTTMRVMNAANAPLAGFKVDEFWYDAKGNPVTGARTFRHPRPLQPGEVINVVLEVPRHPDMQRNQYRFEHANGKIKPVAKPKL